MDDVIRCFEKTRRLQPIHVAINAATSAFSSLLLGYDMRVISVALLLLRQAFHLSSMPQM